MSRVRRSNSHWLRQIATAGILLVASFVSVGCGVDQTASNGGGGLGPARARVVSPALLDDLKRHGEARAIVNLVDPGRGSDRRARIASSREAVAGLAPYVGFCGFARACNPASTTAVYSTRPGCGAEEST
jgi:hypothetical protein